MINRKASKKHSVVRMVEDLQKKIYEVDKLNERFQNRLNARIQNGRSVMPCDRECREYGFDIGCTTKHTSFENFEMLMNDKEFLLQLAKVSPNPEKCENYFYQYINRYLRNDKEFRLEFLKSIYQNDDVYNVDSINYVVELCGLNKENEILLNSESFALVIKQRLEGLHPPVVPYNLDGKDKKGLRAHKIKQNDAHIKWQNQKKGLNEILNTFAINKKQDDLWDR